MGHIGLKTLQKTAGCTMNMEDIGQAHSLFQYKDAILQRRLLSQYQQVPARLQTKSAPAANATANA